MDGAVGIVIMLVGVVVVIALITSASAREKKTKALTGWAERNGWRYQVERPELVGHFEGTPFTGRGNAEHALTGSHRGRKVLQYEYSYTTSSYNGQTTTTQRHVYTITAVETPAPTPVLEVKGRHFGHAILDLLGIHDFRLDDEAFDGTFRVATGDDDFARAVLTEDVRSWLVGHSGGRNPFRFTGDHVICWESIPMGQEPDLQPADFLADLLDRVPGEAWDRSRRA
ncbi:hypothetical protein O4J56_10375 [Nocardiopsis sp. RSe5-2]|uniref:DUF3137 domain-containing protein n=1 Tax=Nocardiopsis endophytica TaxID=3018445 RepID=A0ABT4U2X4_9ACTN|nr:hypothetical protein [Nocardiopsis endophytica]MDA2811041.1 hypothetical protein [Nocardiopsis endophytica]